MFTTIGLKTGKCGHEHSDMDSAQKCLHTHQEELRKSDRVSDRQIFEADSLEEIEDALTFY